MNRKYAANWGRFPKSVVFGRAGDSYKRFTQISRKGAAANKADFAKRLLADIYAKSAKLTAAQPPLCRDFRETPLFAALPLGNGFPLFSPFFRASYYRMGKNSPSSVTLSIKRKEQKQKARFLLLRAFIRNRVRSPLCHPERSGYSLSS